MLKVSLTVGLEVGQSDRHHAKPHTIHLIASWNICTMRGRSSEIVETIKRRNVDLCCVQEVRWRGASARYITEKDSSYKFFWVGNNQGTSGVGVLLAEKWVDKVYDVKRMSDRIMLIKLLLGEAVLTVLSVYAPQTGFEEATKDAFYDSLQTVISELPDKEIVIPCGETFWRMPDDVFGSCYGREYWSFISEQFDLISSY